MSGGYFDYKQYEIGMIADQVEHLMRNPSENWNSGTIEKLEECLHHLKLAQIFAHRVDWLVSGDDGEIQFHERLAQDIARYLQSRVSNPNK